MQRHKAHGARGIAIGNNPERTRTHNRRVVLETVRLHGPLGRAEIARLAHLTAQSVSNIVGELLDEGLLVEQGRRRTGRGQPPVQIAVNPDGGVTVGVEIAADHMAVVLVDIAGRLRAQRLVPLSDTDPGRVAPVLAAGIDAVRRQAPAPDRPPLGIGVVMPGPFGIDGLTSVGPTTLPGWAGVDAAAVLSRAVGAPVTVDNDATAAAVGERLHGAGRALHDFCLVYFGVGLGLGIVSDGRPFRGAFGNAGEIGHVVVVPDGLPCPCGNHGCLERYASLHALRERLAAVGAGFGDTAELAALHRQRHPVLEQWIADAAAHLRPMVAMIENLFDPQGVVFGGALPDGLLDALIAAMEPLPMSVSSRRRTGPRVLRGATGRLTAALGAAALPLLETVMPKLDTAPPAARTPAAALFDDGGRDAH